LLETSRKFQKDSGKVPEASRSFQKLLEDLENELGEEKRRAP
jgi:hypothetical protein